MAFLHSLKARTAFIRQFYEVTAAPYLERIRKIDAAEEPFDQPYYDEYSSDEPAYLEEWMEADESLHVLAYACISMLAASLQLYFKTLESMFPRPAGDLFKAVFKKSGWLAGYKAYFTYYADINFGDCPANLELLEEVVLARNRVQHPEPTQNFKTHYSNYDLKKLSYPFFIDETDAHLLGDADEGEKRWLLPPTLHVTGEKLMAAIEEVEKFCEWLDERIQNAFKQG
jgi:hypothetical protein